MNLWGVPKEYCQQLLFRDDHSFTIRKLPVEKTFVVDKKGESSGIAWMMPYRLLKKFEGYKSTRRCMLLISYGRDIILDSFGQLKDEEKPEKGKGLVKEMISDIATGVFYQHETGKKRNNVDRMVTFVGCTMILLGLAVFIVAAT